jgi:hypothetical protein
MTQEILELASDMKLKNPTWRWGQSVFNATFELYPKQANLYRSTISDCYFRDDLVEEFLKQIENNVAI